VERRLARPVPPGDGRVEYRDDYKRLVLVRDGKEEQLFPPLR